MTQTTTPPDFKSAKPLSISTEKVSAIIVTDQRGHRWAWNMGFAREVDTKKYGEINDIIHDVVAGENTASKVDRWYLVANADCFCPPHVLIQADSLEEALEIFEDECERYIKVEEHNLKDYLKEGKTDKDKDCYADHLKWNNNGNPVDNEQVHAWEVAEIMFIKLTKPE